MDALIVSIILLSLCLKLANHGFPFASQLPLILLKKLVAICWQRESKKTTGAKKAQSKIFYHKRHKY